MLFTKEQADMVRVLYSRNMAMGMFHEDNIADVLDNVEYVFCGNRAGHYFN